MPTVVNESTIGSPELRGFSCLASEGLRRSPYMWQWGATAGENIVDRLHGWGLVGFTRACVIASTFLALGGCGTSNLAPDGGRRTGSMRRIPFATLISARVSRSRTREIRASPAGRANPRIYRSAFPFSGLGRATRTAARSRSRDADRLAAAGRISQGRRRRDEFRGGRCTDGRQDPARRYSSA